MPHITALEDAIKQNFASIQYKKKLLADGRNIISSQLSQQQTLENFHNLNHMMLALQRAEEIIDILTLRYK